MDFAFVSPEAKSNNSGKVSNLSILLLVVILLLVLMHHYKVDNKIIHKVSKVRRSDVSPNNDSQNNKTADDVLADMNSTINDVRGANGIKHGSTELRKQNCMRSFADGNIVNLHNSDVLREAGMYGETVLSQTRDHVENNGIKCTQPRANNTIKCVREFVDEGCGGLSPEEQLAEDYHLLTDYILPVDRSCE